MTIIFILFFSFLIGMGLILWRNTHSLQLLFPNLSTTHFKQISMGYGLIGCVFLCLSNHLTISLIGLSIAGLYSASIALYLGLQKKKQ